MFANRNYRSRSRHQGLVSFTVTVKETNLHIQAASDLSDKARQAVLRCRGFLESYANRHPEVLASLSPISPMPGAPGVVREMAEAGRMAGVGPMASVAGMVAEYTGRELLRFSPEVIVENGGDIFMKIDEPGLFAIFAGDSPLSMAVGVKLQERKTPFSLCTSSGTLGHSKSFGRADAATVLADSCSLADAAATALGNRIKSAADIRETIAFGRTIPGVQGILIIAGKHLGAWGDLELVNLAD